MSKFTPSLLYRAIRELCQLIDPAKAPDYSLRHEVKRAYDLVKVCDRGTAKALKPDVVNWLNIAKATQGLKHYRVYKFCGIWANEQTWLDASSPYRSFDFYCIPTVSVYGVSSLLNIGTVADHQDLLVDLRNVHQYTNLRRDAPFCPTFEIGDVIEDVEAHTCHISTSRAISKIAYVEHKAFTVILP